MTASDFVCSQVALLRQGVVKMTLKQESTIQRRAVYRWWNINI